MFQFEIPLFLGGDQFIGADSNYKEQSVDVWTIVAPVLALILFIFLIILVCILRKRRQNIKQPLEQGAVMTPLMSGFEMNNAQVVAAGGQAAHPHQNGGNAGNYTSISGSKIYFRCKIFLVKTQDLF